MKKRGIAKGSFRMDGGRRWDIHSKLDQPNAQKAKAHMEEGPKSLYEAVEDQRERMENQGSLTDQVVNDFMGGSRAAEYQANAYQRVLDNIKAGNGTREAAGSLAEAARARMIEREKERYRGEENHPDIGRDKADRRAYPPGSGTRGDASESFVDTRENAVALANARSM